MSDRKGNPQPGDPGAVGGRERERIGIAIAPGYLEVRLGKRFAEQDMLDAADEAAIEAFIETGRDNGIDCLLFDVTGSSQSFGINAFRRIAEAHRRKHYRVRKVAVYSRSRAEHLRAELGRVVIMPEAGSPEVRVFADESQAADWLRQA